MGSRPGQSLHHRQAQAMDLADIGMRAHPVASVAPHCDQTQAGAQGDLLPALVWADRDEGHADPSSACGSCTHMLPLLSALPRAGSGRRSVSNALGYTCWCAMGTNTGPPPLLPPPRSPHRTAFSQTSVRSSERRDSRSMSPHSRPPSASASLLNLQRRVDTVTVGTTPEEV